MGVELELDEKVLNQLRQAFGVEETAPAPQQSPSLHESVATKRFSGHIVLKGFSDDVVGSISSDIKLRIQAVRLGKYIRMTIDMLA